MSWKRSDINILKDDSVPLTINQPSTEEFIITTRKCRTKVQCFCSKCNGNLVDPRTKKAHDKKSTLESSFTGETHSPVIPPEETPISRVFIEPTVERHLTPANSDNEKQTFIFIPRKKRVKTSILQHITNEGIENKSDDSNSNNSNETSDIHSDEFSEYSNDDGNDGNDGGIDDEFFNVFEDYFHPILDSPDILKLPKEERFTWILKYLVSLI